MKDAHFFKHLNTQLTQAENELKVLEDDLNTKTRQINKKKIYIKELKNRIANYAIKDPVITEHAMLRYCQRVLGIDLKKIEEKILPPSVKNLAATLGDGEYPIEGGKIKIKNNHVITVLE